MRKVVIIPTYNEKENISAMIDKVFSLPEPFDLLIIDDGSPDGTASIVKQRQQDFPDRLHLLERSGNRASERPILPGSAGHWTGITTMCSRWIAIFRTIRTIWCGSTRRRSRGPMWWWVRVM